MTQQDSLDTLDAHIARQKDVCNVATLRLEALLMARSHVLQLAEAEPPVVAVQVDEASVTLFIRLEDETALDDAAAEVVAPVAAFTDVSPPTALPTELPTELPTAIERAATVVDLASPAKVTPPPAPIPVAASTAVAIRPSESLPAAAPAVDDAREPDVVATLRARNKAVVDAGWTDADLDVIRTRHGAGDSYGQIAKLLGRDAKQVANKGFRLGLRRSSAPAAERLPVSSVPRRKTSHVTPRPADKARPQTPIGQRLDALGNSKLWTPQADLALAMAFNGGLAASQIAKRLKLDPEDAIARWQALCPNRNDKSAIRALVQELEARANA